MTYKIVDIVLTITFQIVELLLGYQANVNLFGEKMWAPVHVASRKGYTPIVEQLIEAGADYETQVEGGVTALYLAAWGGHADTVQLIAERGAEVGDFSFCNLYA